MDFNKYQYVPTVRTRASELVAIENLKKSTKELILPFVGLSKANRVSNADILFEKWTGVFNSPAIIGLAESDRLRVDEYDELIFPENGFRNWHDFIHKAKSKNEAIIPSLIFNKDVGKRDFVRQLRDFETAFERVVLKINPLSRRDIAAATTAASVISSTENILFILDAGQISREHQKAALDATIHGINELRSIEPSIDIVSTSTSFPRMFQAFTKGDGAYGEIPMLEWENYYALGGKSIAIYGDYAGIHGEFYEGSYAKFVARIDYPTPAAWIFERRKQKNAAEEREYLYSQAAKALINSEIWDETLDVWGSRIIKQAAEGKLEKFGAPGKWISVRMNLHIERVIGFLNDNISPPVVVSPDGWEEEDWEDDI